MKHALSMLLVFMATISALADDALNARFTAAASAYDAGNFAEAADAYGELVSAGYVSPELWFNLGNAAYKQGDIGSAVLHYRRAWMLDPRDPDIRANLNFALQHAGAIAPEATVTSNLARKLNAREWVWLGTAAYWTAALLLALAILRPARKDMLMKPAGIAAACLLLSMLGLFSWWQLEQKPEAVVVADGQQALFAPVENSTPHFSLPKGAIVRIHESSGPWAKITYGKDVGWVRRAACMPVYPWDSTLTATRRQHETSAGT